MEETDQAAPAVRKTRSGRKVKSPASAKAKASKPGPASRKAKRKVVLMEVEVSEEEDNATHSDEETKEKAKSPVKNTEENEEELLKSDDEEKVEEAVVEKTNGEDRLDDEDKPLEPHSKEVNGTKKPIEEETLVCNDVEMIDISEKDDLKTTESDANAKDETETNDKNTSEKSDSEENEKKVCEEDVKGDVEKNEPKEEVEKNEPKEEVEKNEPKEDVEKNELKEGVEKNEPKEEVEKNEPKEEVEKNGPKEEVEKNEPKEEVEKNEPKEEVKKNEPKEEVEKNEPKEEVEKMEVDAEIEEKQEDASEEKQEDASEEETKVTSEKPKKVSKAKEEEDDKVSTEEAEESKTEKQQKGDPDAENISEDELPTVQAVKVPETEEVSDEELPGPKRAELPADTEVVSEDELPVKKDGDEEETREEATTTKKKDSAKRKISEGDYDPGSPTSEGETPAKKPNLEGQEKEKEKEEKSPKPKKLPELDKYWKAVNDDPTDFTGWTYLLQYVDQENDMEAAREAYDAFLSHYPYCYGYWRKYADYEKKKGNKKKCEEVFERGLKAIPLSVDLWIHYLTYVKSTRTEDEEFIRSQFERAIAACGLEFRSDRLWDSYIKWETEGKRLQKVTSLYERLLATPTQGYTSHFDNFQEHIASNPPNKVLEVDEFLALRKEVRTMLKQDAAENPANNADVPPGDEDKLISTDEETKCIRERIVSIRRKIHKNTVNAVTARWNYEEGIKRPYFHVKPLERCQLKNWQDYLDYEIEQGDQVRIIVLFERCLIACALYEEFWIKFVNYLEKLNDPEMVPKIRDVYERACTIHHLKKPNIHLQWAMFEESVGNVARAAEILVNLEKTVPNVLQIAYRRINLERRRGDNEKCVQLFEHYITNTKNKLIASNIAIKFSRFCLKVMDDFEKAREVLKNAITKDQNNPRLYLQLIDLLLHKSPSEKEVVEVIDEFLEKEAPEVEQKMLFAQRKLEYLEDFGSDIKEVQKAQELYQKYAKQFKEIIKKKETKSETTSSTKKEKSTTQPSSTSGSYNYNYNNPSAQSYPYSGAPQGQYNYSQYGQGDQYQYQNWQYPQGNYSGYNQWGGYGTGYGY